MLKDPKETPPIAKTSESELKDAEQLRKQVELDRTKKLATRTKQGNREDLETALQLQNNAVKSLAVVVKSLDEAIKSVESMNQFVSKNKFCREVSLGRKFKVQEALKTIASAKAHLSRISSSARMSSNVVRDSIEELTDPYPRHGFE